MTTDEARRAIDQILAGSRSHDLESDTLDFKEEQSAEDQAIRTLVDASLCFANGAGGTVVVGVANKVPGSAALRAPGWKPSSG